MNTVPQEQQVDKVAHKLGTNPATPDEFEAAFAAAEEFGNDDEQTRVQSLLREQLAAKQEEARQLAWLYGKHISPHGYTICDITDLISVVPGEEGGRFDAHRNRLEEAFAVLIRPDPDDDESEDSKELLQIATMIRSQLRNLHNRFGDDDIQGHIHGATLKWRMLAALDLLNRPLDDAECIKVSHLRNQCYAVFAAAGSARDVGEHFAKMVGMGPAHGPTSNDDYKLHQLGNVHREMLNAWDAAHRALGIIDKYDDDAVRQIEAYRKRVQVGGDNAVRMERAGAAFVDAVTLAKSGSQALRAIGVALSNLEQRAAKGDLTEDAAAVSSVTSYLSQYGNRIKNAAWLLENSTGDQGTIEFGTLLDSAERELALLTEHAPDADTVDGAVDASLRALTAIQEARSHHAAWESASKYARACRTVVARREGTSSTEAAE